MTEGYRECSKCHAVKELSLYPKNSKCEQGRTRICKECTNSRARQWVSNVAKKQSSFRERRQLSQDKVRAKQYGLTLEEFKVFRERSGGLCEICLLPPAGDRSSSKVLQLDHCHTTGKLRGMLCVRCNLILGRVEDDPAVLRKMADYLERNKQ